MRIRRKMDKKDKKTQFDLMSFVQHILVGGVACFLAFLFSVQFLTPVFSEDPPEHPYSKLGEETPDKTIGKATKGFVKEAGQILKETFSEQGKSSGQGSQPSSPPAKNSQTVSEQPNQNKVNQIGNVDEALIEVEEHMTPFIYDPFNRRNPFEDPMKARLQIQEEAIEVEVKTPTPPEMYTLQQIDLKGIIWRTTESPKALVKLPTGAFYTLLRGDKIGKNGVIFEIREDEMVVLETMTKQSGTQKIQDASITIKRMDRLGQGVRRLQL